MSSPAQPDVPIWAQVLDLLEQDDRVTPQLQGFLSLAVPAGVMGATLYLDVPNDLTAAQINKRLRVPLMEGLAQLGEEVTSFRVVVNHELAEQPTAPIAVADFGRPEAPRTDLTIEHPARMRHEPRLSPKCTFATFVIGQSNRFSHAGAVAVAEAPARAYNPLFISGDSGLGKTHLLHAIGDYAQSLYAGVKVRYVSSEEFTNDFINSIANNRGAAFQSRYREVDILMIDDIRSEEHTSELQSRENLVC